MFVCQYTHTHTHRQTDTHTHTPYLINKTIYTFLQSFPTEMLISFTEMKKIYGEVKVGYTVLQEE